MRESNPTPIYDEKDVNKYIKSANQIIGVRTPMEKIHLNKYLSIPSAIHGYSIAIEYMRYWFLEKFPKNFFRTVHVNGKHVLADYRRFNGEKLVRIEKPAVAIVPTLNNEYNNDMVDLIQGGGNIFTRRSQYWNDRFFIDNENNIYLGMQMKQIEMPFTFKVKLSSRAQQLDFSEFVKINCRIGSTETHFVDTDVSVPYDMMLAVAMDMGFELHQDVSGLYRIKDINTFIRYLNSNSCLPFMYKLRTINGRPEFFIRLNGCHTHISCLDGISIDDGERVGSLDKTFGVEFQATLRFTVPAIFAYYSKQEHRIQNRDLSGDLGMYQMVSTKPPEYNTKGWEQYLTTQWDDYSKHIGEICFDELLVNTEIQKVMDYNISIGLSPSIFMDVIIYNGQQDLNATIDWKKRSILVNADVREPVSDIAIYADLEYINKTLINIEGMDKSRIKNSEKGDKTHYE